MSDEPQVLAVIDAREPAFAPWRAWPPLMDWIREHDGNPQVTFRVEVLLLDAPLVRFHEYDHDGAGRLLPLLGREIAKRAPRDVLLRRMPPELEPSR